jgi:hypothetical protein
MVKQKTTAIAASNIVKKSLSNIAAAIANAPAATVATAIL